MPTQRRLTPLRCGALCTMGLGRTATEIFIGGANTGTGKRPAPVECRRAEGEACSVANLGPKASSGVQSAGGGERSSTTTWRPKTTPHLYPRPQHSSAVKKRVFGFISWPVTITPVA
jgi:hypothetical protein